MNMMVWSGLLKLTAFGDNMKNYQFRTNWLGQLVLQRRTIVNTGYFGEPEYGYVSATTQDLKHYYQQLHQLQHCSCGTQREMFEQDCG